MILYYIVCHGVPVDNDIIKERRRLVDHKHVYNTLLVVTVVAMAMAVHVSAPDIDCYSCQVDKITSL